jgi:hypothetical protein
VAYVLRSVLLDIFQSVIKNLFARYIFLMVLNIVWLIFPFWLLFVISPIYFVAIVSFLVVAISLTFQNIINNIASGIMLLSSEGFEAGDLIETNGVGGIVKEITLNHLKLEDFDGSFTYIPNKNAFNSSVVRYTHKPIKKEEKLEISEVIRKFGKIVIGEEKLTRYITVVELLVTVDTDKIDEILEPIFLKFESVFGIKPYYYANYTVSGITNRLSITLQILTKNPTLILKHKDQLLKEMLFNIYEHEINLGWNDKDNYKKSNMEGE